MVQSNAYNAQQQTVLLGYTKSSIKIVLLVFYPKQHIQTHKQHTQKIEYNKKAHFLQCENEHDVTLL